MKTIGAIFEQPSIQNDGMQAQKVPVEQTDVAETEKVDYNSLPVQSLRKILRQERGLEDAASLPREECLALLTGEADSNESA